MSKIIMGKNIVKNFGAGKGLVKVLDGVDIGIEKGEFVCLMGPSGSGKTTLLFVLSGMDNITGGEVWFEGVELSRLSEDKKSEIRRTRMGFVFQHPAMLKNLNILDNIIISAAKPGLREKAKSLMNKTGINGLAPRGITEVSGGQLSRAGICRALINDPEIIFADEPTGALNSKSAEEIMDLLSVFNREGTAILLVTHDPKVAVKADRVIFLKDGHIASELFLGRFSGEEHKRHERILSEAAPLGI